MDAIYECVKDLELNSFFENRINFVIGEHGRIHDVKLSNTRRNALLSHYYLDEIHEVRSTFKAKKPALDIQREPIAVRVLKKIITVVK